ncbi:MAG: cytochrome c oxidase subunit II [Polyangiaceae bacterium]
MSKTPIASLIAAWQPAIPPFPESESFWMPKSSAAGAGEVDGLYFFIYWTSVVSVCAVVASMVYLLVKFRSKGRSASDRAQSQHDHSTSMEVIWSVLPLPFVLAFFYIGFQGYTKMRTPPRGSVTINVQGQKWAWNFTHAGGCNDNVLHVPVNKPVRLVISSVDVLHSVWIPNFRVKMDAVPGRYTDLWFNATEVGEFPLECTEYCGKGHSEMLTKVVVESQEAYDTYLAGCGKIEITAEGGKTLFEKKGCATCHSVDGTTKVGPSFKGLWGKEEALTAGTAKVDENYIRESVLEPQAKVVKGFPPAMPTYKGQLSDDEITALIEYIKSLK